MKEFDLMECKKHEYINTMITSIMDLWQKLKELNNLNIKLKNISTYNTNTISIT